ncbi:ester cyclase [Larkinella bovis]|uniref:Ester cyclase n=1 Tax=Larkinella bovis TaxID=683041 RepID=A0ABW0ICD4_9BACT
MNTIEQHKETVRRLYEEVITSGNLAQLTEIFDENYTGIGIGQGPAAFQKAVEELLLAFPDLAWTVHDVFGEGDKVAIRWSWKGTHREPFKGIPASGKTVTNDANAIYQFRGNKIIFSWLQSDRLGVLQQLDVRP